MGEFAPLEGLLFVQVIQADTELPRDLNAIEKAVREKAIYKGTIPQVKMTVDITGLENFGPILQQEGFKPGMTDEPERTIYRKDLPTAV